MGTTWIYERGHEDHQYPFVLAVANTEQIGIMIPGGGKLVTVKEAEQLSVQPQDWQQFSVKTGQIRAAHLRLGVCSHLAPLGRRWTALVTYSPYSQQSDREDLLPGVRTCGHDA